jgi:diguanylate cyclase (GGDEF)-like protein
MTKTISQNSGKVSSVQRSLRNQVKKAEHSAVMGAVGGRSERDLMEYYLEHFTQFDTLTGLPNRRQFHDLLSRALERTRRRNEMLGVMLLNVDAFKAINFKCGYLNGDQVLKELAFRMQALTRKSDTLARLGGDEFAVILEDLAGAEEAAVPAKRALAELCRPLLVAGGAIPLSVTIGIALSPRDAADPDGLLRTADMAMSDAKEHAPGSYRFYSQELDSRTRRDESRRAEIERKLMRLTPREQEVLKILIEGKANKMIAYVLGTSARTVENHRASIMRKMEADSLAQLVRMVIDHRMVAAATAAPAALCTRGFTEPGAPPLYSVALADSLPERHA